MAIMGNGPLSGISGRVGHLVFFQRNGKTFVKEYKKRAKAETPGALEAQEKFKRMMQFLNPARSIIGLIYKGHHSKIKNFSEVFAENRKRAIYGSYDDIHIDYSKIIISIGDLSAGEQVLASLTSPEILEISWKNVRGKLGSKFDDDAFIACFCEESRDWMCKTQITKRRNESYRLNVESFLERTIHVYFGFTSDFFSMNSDSLYLGKYLIDSSSSSHI
jgi:Family of unknown function (DUF6266)